jgi:hypothetical protein
VQHGDVDRNPYACDRNAHESERSPRAIRPLFYGVDGLVVDRFAPRALGGSDLSSGRPRLKARPRPQTCRSGRRTPDICAAITHETPDFFWAAFT